MMRFLRKGQGYALKKPIKKNYYQPLYSFKCLLLSLSAYCYQFSCNVQESRASGTTGYAARLMAVLAHVIQVLRTVYKQKSYKLDICLTHEPHMNETTKCVKDGGDDERKRLRQGVRSDGGKDNQQAGSKQAWSMHSVSSFNTLLIHCYYFTHTWLILRPYTKVSKGRDEVGIKRGYSRLGLLTILCVLFSFASVVEAQAQELRQGGATVAKKEVSDTATRGHRIIPYRNESVIKRLEENTSYDLKKFPMVVYDIDRALVDGVAIGGQIPNELWNIPLQIVNGEGEIKNISLSEFDTDQILILDFWTTWCRPCIESVIKWEAISAKAPDRVKVVNVLLDFEYKAPLFLAKRDWQSPTAIGMNAYLLNAHFFTAETFGKIVWIHSGKLRSITTASQLSEQELEDVVMGRLDFPESLKEGVYGFNLSQS